MDRRFAWGLAGATFLALAVRLWDLGKYGLWTDEMYSFNVAHLPLPSLLRDVDQTPPLFVLFLHGWMALAGTSDVAVRLPSALLGAGTAACAALCARRFMGPRASFLAGGVAALHLYLVIEGQDARAYSLLAFTSALSMLAFLRLEERWTRGRAAAHALATAAVAYSHLFGLFAILAQHLYVLATRRPSPWWSTRWLVPQATAGLAFAAWLPALAQAASHVAHGFWIQATSWRDVYWTRFVVGGGVLGGYLLAAGTVLAAVAWFRKAKPREGPPRELLLWLWLTVPVVVPAGLSLWLPFFQPRYALAAAVALAILAAYGVAALPRRAGEVAGVLLVAALAAQLAFFFATGQKDSPKQDWPAAAVVLGKEAGQGALVVMNKGSCDSRSDRDLMCSLKRYSQRPDLVLAPFFFEDRGVSQPVDAADVAALDLLVANRTEVWVLYSYDNDPGHAILARLHADGFCPTQSWALKKIDLHRFLACPTPGAQGLA